MKRLILNIETIFLSCFSLGKFSAEKTDISNRKCCLLIAFSRLSKLLCLVGLDGEEAFDASVQCLIAGSCVLQHFQSALCRTHMLTLSLSLSLARANKLLKKEKRKERALSIVLFSL